MFFLVPAHPGCPEQCRKMAAIVVSHFMFHSGVRLYIKLYNMPVDSCFVTSIDEVTFVLYCIVLMLCSNWQIAHRDGHTELSRVAAYTQAIDAFGESYPPSTNWDQHIVTSFMNQ